MAVIEEEYCVGCPDSCIGSSCKYFYPIKYYTCDNCEESDIPLYWDTDNKTMLCATCLSNKYKRDLVDYFWDDIVDNYAYDYAENCFDKVDQDD